MTRLTRHPRLRLRRWHSPLQETCNRLLKLNTSAPCGRRPGWPLLAHTSTADCRVYNGGGGASGSWSSLRVVGHSPITSHDSMWGIVMYMPNTPYVFMPYKPYKPERTNLIKWYCLFMIVYNDDAGLELSDSCVRSSLLSWVELSWVVTRSQS